MRHLVIFLEVVALLLFLAIVSAKSEQLSTVFVLETADSPESASSSHNAEEAAAPVIKAKSLDDSNTRIITDSSLSTTASPSNKQQKQASSSSNNSFKISIINQQQHDPTPSSVPSNESNNPQRRSSHQATQSDESIHLEESRNREVSSARRIEEEAQLVPAKANPPTRITNNNYNQQAPSQRPRSTTTTTTTSSYDHDDTHNHQSISTPKVEERLLISITSEDDDNTYKPPHKNSGTSVNGQSDELGPSQQQQGHQLQKRKPSITISIQDANINKQNGGSGPSAVIVRPGEDGQSIVIATVGASNNHNNNHNNNQDNKYVNQRPPSSGGFTSNGNNNNNNNHLIVTEAPYREPINNPIQNIINQHMPTSTTRRPLVNNDYNPSINNQRPPITSTLVEPQRPSSQVSDERPPRPPIVGLDQESTNYESHSRPTSRPITRPPPPPPGQDSYSFNNNNNNNNNNNQDNNYQDTNRPVSEVGSTGLPTGVGESKYPLNEKNCGLVHETRIVGGEEADPDDFLWMAAIIKSRPKEGEARPFCGGSLITRRHILTAAHCLEGLAPRDVLVRLGSYDFDDSTASSLSADFAIDQFRVPAQYSKKTHMADIAIMRLKTPLQTTDNYKTVCMPQARRSYVGALGTVTGYGSQSQTFRRAAPKLRQVTVPIWENRKCSVVYKKNLTESFLCAGYEEGGKDACQGDSGGPLMTEGPNERMMIVGVVSHGIGCGSPGYPGVYTRTTTFLDWIEKNTRE